MKSQNTKKSLKLNKEVIKKLNNPDVVKNGGSGLGSFILCTVICGSVICSIICK